MFLIKKKFKFNGPNRYLFILAGFFSFLTLIFFGINAVQAAFTPQINYQGKLSDSSGNPVVDGSYHMRFRLCQDSACASAIYDETFTDTNKVTVTDGLFSVMIGSVSSTLGSVDFNQDTYLEVRIGSSTTVPSWETLTPRKRLGAVPNAFNAEKLDGLATTSFLRADIANARATITSLTSTNFFASYMSSSAATSTNLFANILNALTAVISDLTATIANIVTLTFGTATGNSLTAANLTATSTANLKTLYASSTTIVGDLSVTGNSTTTGNWAVVSPATSTSLFSIVFTDMPTGSSSPVVRGEGTYNNNLISGMSVDGIFSIIEDPNNSANISGLAPGAWMYFLDNNYNAIGGMVVSSTLDRLQFTAFDTGGVLFDNKVNFNGDVYLNKGLAMGTTTDPGDNAILMDVTDSFKPIQFNHYVTLGNQTLLNAFTYQTADSAYSDSPIQASLFANYSSSTIADTLSSAIKANLIVGNGSGEDAAGLHAYITSNVGESAPSNIYGVYSENLAKASSTYGARLKASGSGSDTNYGLYVDASGGTTNWAGYFNDGNVYIADYLGIGTTTPTVALAVNGAVNLQGANFATTTIGDYSSNIQIKEAFYDLGVYGSYSSPLIYGNSNIPAAANMNTVFDNNASVLGRTNNDPTFKLIASNFEFINMKYVSSSNELSYTLSTLAGNSNDVLYKYNGRSEVNTTLEASSGQQSASQVSLSVSQSGSAGFVASTIGISTTTVGSGIQLISQWSVNGLSKFDVDLDGDTRVNNLLLDIDQTGTANLGLDTADEDLLTLTSGKLTVNGTTTANAAADQNAAFELREGGNIKWTMYNDAADDRFYLLSSTSTGVFLAAGATSWAASSDVRLKENIVPMENALEKIMKLTGYTYNLIGNNRTEIGLVAQEVLPEFPELVEAGGKYLALHYDRIGPILIQAIKEQQAQIESLKADSAALAVDSAPDGSAGISDLPVSSAATFYGTITVKGEANFESKVVFKDHVYFDKDAAGIAKVSAGATSTSVVFVKPYETAPVISVTPKANANGHNWWVERESTDGFTIAVDPVFDVDFEFNWQAMAVKVDDSVESVESVVVEPVETVVSGSSEPAVSVSVASGDSLDNSNPSDNMPVGSGSVEGGSQEQSVEQPTVETVESPESNQSETPSNESENSSASESPVAETPVSETPAVSESAPTPEAPSAPASEAPSAPTE